jgi:outer membrane protein insertion porin family
VHCSKRIYRKPSPYPHHSWSSRRGPAAKCGRAACTLFIFVAFVTGQAKLLDAQQTPSLAGRPVTSLQLKCDCNLTLQNFPGEVIQKLHQPLDPALISESLKHLYASGRFTELKADGVPESDGVAITFVARAQYFVGVVTAEGNPSSIEARAVVTASRLRLGQPLTEESIDAAQKRLNNLLLANGYYQSVITNQVNRDPDTQEANVVFTIQPGRPARVSVVQFTGDSVYPTERLMKVSGWHPHTFLTATKLEHGLYKLRQFYLARGRIQASVDVQRRDFDSKTNTEKLIVKVQSGPLLRVRVQGADISSAQLQNLLPLYHDGVVDDPSLALSSKILEGYFQRKGYFFVKVKPTRTTRSTPSPSIDILFSVELGQHEEFAGFGLKGNSAIPSAELLSTITHAPEGLFPAAQVFSQESMEQKISTLQALYQSRGYLDVHISPAIDDRFGGLPGRRFVTLVIDEGARTSVHTLTLTGIDAQSAGKIRPTLVCQPSKPYSVEGAHADRDRILDYLADHGYSHAAASWHTAPASSPHEVNLEFEISQGVQDRVKKIVLLGNDHARSTLVNRELQVHEGEALNQSAVQDSQRRLYNLGIFNQVQITPQDQPDSETDKTLLVSLEESKRWILGYGGGFEVQQLGSNQPQGNYKASPRLSLSLTRLDVGGRGQTFSMSGRLSNIDTGANMGYLIPRLFNRDDLSLRVNGLVDRSRDVLTFTADRKEASISVEKRFHTGTLLIGEYSFRRVEALDISTKISPQEIPLLSQPALVGMVSGSFVQDHRNDPSDATRGYYTLIDAGASWRGFGSQANFLRFTGQNSTYHALNSFLVFARKTQYGVVSPYGSPYTITVPASGGQPAQEIVTDSIPLPERFFMGGSESMRGFSINQAGPRDPETGYPIGGNALFLNSFELRTSFAHRRLGLVLFQDAGNVYTSSRLMRIFKFHQSSPTDFNYTSAAVGTGLRYKTPVGPIRFDVGYNLNPPRFNVITTTNGVTTTEVQRLSNLQFFLSIGQSF